MFKSLLLLPPVLLSTVFAAAIDRSNLTLSNTPSQTLWQPEFGSKWQIVLSSVVDINKIVQDDVNVYDVDLADTPKETIQGLKDMGKKVICYFSAGTSEDWRVDYSSFLPDDKLSCMGDWKGERWLDVSKPHVFEVMKKRIQIASEKGCDAIDPDNMGKPHSSILISTY
jgi:hypothetical protein